MSCEQITSKASAQELIGFVRDLLEADERKTLDLTKHLNKIAQETESLPSGDISPQNSELNCVPLFSQGFILRSCT